MWIILINRILYNTQIFFFFYNNDEFDIEFEIMNMKFQNLIIKNMSNVHRNILKRMYIYIEKNKILNRYLNRYLK